MKIFKGAWCSAALIMTATGLFAGIPSCTSSPRVRLAAAPITGPLKASASNPNYFEDASGTPVALCGSHSWNTVQDWGTGGTPTTLDFNAFVSFLTAHGHNFTLLWTTELPKFSNLPVTASSPPDFTVNLFPWQRTGPGNGTDGKLKFDLTKFNQTYFDVLRARTQALNTAGIYAGIYFFTGEWLKAFRSSSDGYPFSGANNINGIADDGALSSITMGAPNAITGVQDALVKKIIDTLNDLPNVLWIVSEEAPSGAAWWNGHLISTARTYEATKPFKHPIGYASPDNGDTALYNSDADWVAPIARLSPTQTTGSGTPTRKVNINDSDHSYFGMWNDSAQTNRNYAWENFANGNQVVFMDPYVVYYPRENRNLSPSPVNGISGSPDPRWNNFRDNLGYLVTYSRKLNLANVSAHGSLSSTSWCLAQIPATGAEYLVYAPSGGTFTVNLSAMAAARSLNVEWFNPSNGTTTAAGTVAAGATRSFTSPFGGDAVLYLVDTAGHAGAPPVPTPPSITMQPSNKTVTVGQTATFTVAASGSTPLNYQWQKGTTNISGATSASYTTPATTLGDSGTTYRCVVSNGAGSATSNSATLTVQPASSTLPSPWLDADVGSPAVSGSAGYSGGTFTVNGSGADIWGTSDQFNFAYQSLTGDGEIIARMAGLGNTNAWAKAGVMIRETLNANSAYAFTALTPSNGAQFQHRDSTGAAAATEAGPMVVVPYWVRLLRLGDTFTSYVSPDGSTWTQVGMAHVIPMASTAFIGIAVTSHDPTVTTAAMADSVGGTGGWPVGGGAPTGGGAAPAASSGGHRHCGGTGLEGLAVLACLGLLGSGRRRRSWASNC